MAPRGASSNHFVRSPLADRLACAEVRPSHRREQSDRQQNAGGEHPQSGSRHRDTRQHQRAADHDEVTGQEDAVIHA